MNLQNVTFAQGWERPLTYSTVQRNVAKPNTLYANYFARRLRAVLNGLVKENRSYGLPIRLSNAFSATARASFFVKLIKFPPMENTISINEGDISCGRQSSLLADTELGKPEALRHASQL